MLELNDVSHVYGNGTRALDHVTLSIPRGMYGLLGPNGAGKSTLMRAIATLQTPTEGTIRFGDLDVIAEPEKLRRTLGYLPQDFGVYPRVSAYEMLDHMAVLKGVASPADRKTTVETLLHQTNLWTVRKKMLSGFSGGMRQRFGIAQALEHGHVVEHFVRGDARIDAEILRQIAERAAQFLRLADDVDIAEADAPFARRLQRGDGAHHC